MSALYNLIVEPQVKPDNSEFWDEHYDKLVKLATYNGFLGDFWVKDDGSLVTGIAAGCETRYATLVLDRIDIFGGLNGRSWRDVYSIRFSERYYEIPDESIPVQIRFEDGSEDHLVLEKGHVRLLGIAKEREAERLEEILKTLSDS